LLNLRDFVCSLGSDLPLLASLEGITFRSWHPAYFPVLKGNGFVLDLLNAQKFRLQSLCLGASLESPRQLIPLYNPNRPSSAGSASEVVFARLILKVFQ
jgi:hypothetical protein